MDSKRLGGGALAIAGVAILGQLSIDGFYMILTYFYHDGALDVTAMRTAGGLLMLGVGLFLLFRPTNKAEIEAMKARLVQTMARCLQLLEGYQAGQRPPELYGEIAAVYSGLERLGITTPRSPGDLQVAFEQGRMFIRNIYPMVRDDHLKDARREAPRIIRAAGAETIRPRVWYNPISWIR